MKTNNPYKVNYCGKEYQVKFFHDRFYPRLTELSSNNPNIPNNKVLQAKTIAYIEIKDDERITATSFCSAFDQFSKRVGREIAMGRLVKKLREIEFQMGCGKRDKFQQLESLFEEVSQEKPVKFGSLETF